MIEQQLTVSGRGVETPFKGEVPVSSFITGDALAAAIGLTVGISQHSDEPWLKFLDPVDGKTKYIAKKPIRRSVTWDQIHAVGAVFGTRTLWINGNVYRVRLLKGTNSDPYVGGVGFDMSGTHNSEWNRLLYRISGKPFAHAGNTLASEGITEGDWAQYSETDLLTCSEGTGSYNWCQETSVSNADNRVYRGGAGVSYVDMRSGATTSPGRGWRPCLELVE